MKAKLSFVLLAVFLVVSVVFSGPIYAKELKIGNLGALSGFLAFVGKTSEAGVIMAADKVNAAGGITVAGERYTLKLISYDTKYNNAVARTAAERLIFEDKVKFIMGAASMDTMGFQAVTEANKVMIFPVGGAIQASPKNPYTFRSSFPVEIRYEALYDFVKKRHPKLKRVALINPDTPIGQAYGKMARAGLEKNDFSVAASELAAAGSSDFMPLLTGVLRKKIDIIDLGGNAGGSASALIIKQARELGYTGLIVSPVSLLSKTVLDVAGRKNLEGIYDNSFEPDDPAVSAEFRQFLAKYAERFPTPFNSLVSDYYDVASGFFSFLDGQDTLDTEVLKDRLAEYKWEGVNGKLYWGGEKTYGIKRQVVHADYFSIWKNGTPRIIDSRLTDVP